MFKSGFLSEENENIHPSPVAYFNKACLVNQNTKALGSDFLESPGTIIVQNALLLSFKSFFLLKQQFHATLIL